MIRSNFFSKANPPPIVGDIAKKFVFFLVTGLLFLSCGDDEIKGGDTINDQEAALYIHAAIESSCSRCGCSTEEQLIFHALNNIDCGPDHSCNNQALNECVSLIYAIECKPEIFVGEMVFDLDVYCRSALKENGLLEFWALD